MRKSQYHCFYKKEPEAERGEPAIVAQAGSVSDYEVLPGEAEFVNRARSADKNTFGLGVNFNGKRYQFGIWDKNGNRVGSEYSYAGDYGVKIAWKDKDGSVQSVVVRVPRFRSSYENESSNEWHEKYIDWQGKTLRRVIKAYETNSIDELNAEFEQEKSGAEGAGQEEIRQKIVSERNNFKSVYDKFLKGEIQTQAIIEVGSVSSLLKENGVSNDKIFITQSVLKKIKRHGIADETIKELPAQVYNPIAIFSYPKSEKSFDLLIELKMPDGRPIIVSLKTDVKRQGLGLVSDVRSMHPKENLGRLIDWAEKGRLRHWDMERGRKFLQDSAPANWEQYETKLLTSLNSQS
ncbi:MAG: hypothetical protein IKS15_03275 [Opitutales bacterium]|nr:hypothetical protein [Opitutales bacterium]